MKDFGKFRWLASGSKARDSYVEQNRAKENCEIFDEVTGTR
jgi:hypothetical protein